MNSGNTKNDSHKASSIFRKMKMEPCIHIVCWIFVLASPFLLFDHNSSTFNWLMLFRQLIWQSVLMIVFYANYLFLVPKLLQKDRQIVFLFSNVVLIACCCIFLNLRMEMHNKQMEQERIENFNQIKKENNQIISNSRPSINKKHKHPRPPFEFIRIQNLFTLILGAGLAAAIRMSQEWRKAENARKEAELGLAEAELKNLRSQINPHFLLNTLNNIYALIAFDRDKAQAAVHDLSKLLRHALYDNQQSFVPLTKEIDFLRGYIELMRIRLASHVSLNIEFDIKPDTTTQIAPLIFISLIENSFKHGISPTEPSHINISIKESSQWVECRISNSNFPKGKSDQSGSGIGIMHVQKRLELMYPDKYMWQRGISEDGKEYISHLTINTKNIQS